MKIALFGKKFDDSFKSYFSEFLHVLVRNKSEIFIYKPFYEFISSEVGINPSLHGFFGNGDMLDKSCDLMVSIGGDGTFLESVPYAVKNDIPVIGINSGRLGFLSYISKNDIFKAFDDIFNRKYDIEERTMIKFFSPKDIFPDMNYALNEITIQKSDASLITIEAYVNDELLNTYWTDGLIISTPTGSTAYSLSVGGPVVVPGSGNFIISPIASHNLTVRALILPDDLRIRLKVFSRKGSFLVTADNRTFEAASGSQFVIGRSDYRLKMLRLPNTSFYNTLRTKLMWGSDKRNWQ